MSIVIDRIIRFLGIPETTAQTTSLTTGFGTSTEATGKYRTIFRSI